MAVLPDEDRRRCFAHYMRQPFGNTALSKSDLRAAFDAMDDFLNTNGAAINNALPTNAKNNLTGAQKATVLAYVAFRRAGLLHVAEDG